MIISNKKFTRPKTISLFNNEIDVVENFKLLGVTIDNKLNFMQHASNVSSMINRKLFSIKRIFCLPYSVKIQFFKSFIMPYYDYCSSLIIYWSKTAIRKIVRSFYNSVRILLRINLCNKTIFEIDNILGQQGLRSIQSRYFYKLLLNVQNINYNVNAPVELKEMLINNQVTHEYNFRISTESQNCYRVEKLCLRAGERTFGVFYSRLFNKLKINLSLFDKPNFQIFINNNFYTLYNNFINNFDFLNFIL